VQFNFESSDNLQKNSLYFNQPLLTFDTVGFISKRCFYGETNDITVFMQVVFIRSKYK
jgi:hypothetical protein